MGRFLRIGGVWVRHVNNSCNFDPRTRLGVKCKEQLAEPCKKNLFWNNCHLRDKCGTLVKQTQRNLGGTMHKTLVEPSAEPFGSPKRICPREPWRVRKQFCPETFTMAEDPKLLLLGKNRIKPYILVHVCVAISSSPTLVLQHIVCLGEPAWIDVLVTLFNQEKGGPQNTKPSTKPKTHQGINPIASLYTVQLYPCDVYYGE